MEEPGWTGFAVPKPRLRYSAVTTSLLVGTVWGAWHLLTNDPWGGAGGAGNVAVALFLTMNGVLMVVGQLPVRTCSKRLVKRHRFCAAATRADAPGRLARPIAYDGMQDLMELFRHNTWANAKVFELAASLDSQMVTEVAHGTRDTVLGTLAHLAAVEYAYLAMLEGHPPQSREDVQAWAAHPLSWFPEQMRNIGDRFVRLLEASTPDTLAAPLNVPWFTFRLTAREGLRQVLTHSAQHRSQVLSWLSTQGIDTPDLDYVLMLRAERTPRE